MNNLKEPSKIKDAVVGWKVDSQKLRKKPFRKFLTKESTLISAGEPNINLQAEVTQLFELANDMEFEDGYESLFSRSLFSFIEKYGKQAIEEISHIFINKKINPEIISEALRWIGRMEHSQTFANRRQLLEQCLFSPSPYIRDGALLGIASMNDRNSIHSLKLAIVAEKISELYDDMKQVLFQLESDGNGADNENHS